MKKITQRALSALIALSLIAGSNASIFAQTEILDEIPQGTTPDSSVSGLNDQQVFNEPLPEVLTTSTITGLAIAGVTTKKLEAPKLPQTVTATYEDTTTAEVAVTWAAVEAESYANAGQFDVAGTVAGTELPAKCVVTVVEDVFKVNAQVEGSVGGNVSPQGYVDIPYGGSKQYVFTPWQGYKVARVIVNLTGTEVDVTSQVQNNTYTLNNVTSSGTLNVKFEEVVTVEGNLLGAAGTIYSGSSERTEWGTAMGLASVAFDGKRDTRWCSAPGAPTTGHWLAAKLTKDITFNKVVVTTGMHPINAYTVEYKNAAGEWTVVPDVEFTPITAVWTTEEFNFDDITASEIRINIQNPVGETDFAELEAYYVDKDATFEVAASATGRGGSITNDGKNTVALNKSISFEFNADAGHKLQALYVDGRNATDLVVDNAYTFSDVKSSHSIEAFFTQISEGNTTYYVDDVMGNDENDGTSAKTPWKSLDRLNAVEYAGGDKILFKAGGNWIGQFWPKGSGEEGAPIMVDKYGDSNLLPCLNGNAILRVNRKTHDEASTTIRLVNQQYWEFRNLHVMNDDDLEKEFTGYGDDGYAAGGEIKTLGKNRLVAAFHILIDLEGYDKEADRIMDHIYIEDCEVTNVDMTNPNVGLGGGINFFVDNYGRQSKIFSGAKYNDVKIKNNKFIKVDRSATYTAFAVDIGGDQSNIAGYDAYSTKIYVGHNYYEDCGGGVYGPIDLDGMLFEHNTVNGYVKNYVGVCTATCGFRTWNTVFQYNELYNGPSQNQDGTPFDLDYGLVNFTHQYNYTHDNPCGWMLYMGKNYMDVTRYNVSMDNGDHILKYFLFDNSSTTYFTNNIFIYDSERTDFHAGGYFSTPALFTNNIFYNVNTEKTSRWTKNVEMVQKSTTFKNNCFYEASGIHSEFEPKDESKMTVEPGFVGGTGAELFTNRTAGIEYCDNFKLKADSPMIDKGTYVPEANQTHEVTKVFPQVVNNKDFFETELYWGEGVDIGIHELKQGEHVIPEPLPVNLARGEGATYSASNSQFPTIPSSAFDGVFVGNFSEHSWTPGVVPTEQKPEWIEVDFGKNVTINQVLLAQWQGDYVRDWKLQYTDGKDEVYKDIVNGGVIAQKEGTTVNFKDISARKLRLTINKATNAPWITEMQAFNNTGERHDITSTIVGGSGTISPSGGVQVFPGESQTITVLPDPNYTLKSVKDNDVDVTDKVVDNEYIIENVQEDHTISVEFERVADANLALEKGATYSASSSHSKFQVTGAFDQDKINYDKSRWVCGEENETPYWVEIDFGKSMNFDKVVLTSGHIGYVDYVLQYMNDSDEWVDIESTYPDVTEKGKTVEYLFNPVNAQKLRLYIEMPNHQNAYGVDLCEFEVYSTMTVEEYAVTFDVDGIETVVEGTNLSPIEPPADPQKDGYVFKGWFTEKIGGTEVTSFNFTGTVYAQFEAVVPSDKTALEKKINQAKKIEVSEFMLSTTVEFMAASQNATAIFDKADATAEEIADAYKRLRTAIFQLRLNPDKSKLEDLIS